jgi:lysophospholipase L1-like esterase
MHAFVLRPLGDSITLGVSNPVGLIPGYRGTIFTSMLTFGEGLGNFIGALYDAPAGPPGADAAPINRFLNRDSHHDGHSGFTIPQLETQVVDGAATLGVPDFTTLIAGTNDAAGGASGATMLARMTSLLNTLFATYPDRYVFVGSIPLVPGFEPARDAFNGGLRAACVAIGQPKCRYVDTCGDFTAADQGVLPGPVVDPHPSAQGYAKIAARFFAAISPIAGAM